MKYYIILVMVLLVAGAVSYYLWKLNYQDKANLTVASYNYTNVDPFLDTQNPAVISNKDMNFSFRYPGSWRYAKNESGDSFYTIYPTYGPSIVEFFVVEGADSGRFKSEPAARKDAISPDFLTNNFFSFKGYESKKFKGKVADDYRAKYSLNADSEMQIIQFKTGDKTFVFTGAYSVEKSNEEFLTNFNAMVQSLKLSEGKQDL